MDELIKVHTSGSTGQPKEMLVEKSRMMASARMTCDFLGLRPGDTALLCMPLDYIAGKMMLVRCEERNMKLIRVTPTNHPLANLDCHIDFAAMVPSQVYESLKVPTERERLSRIGNLIIGGGAISSDMERELKTFPNAVWSTYGMTETLSHIAMRRLSGNTASQFYTPLDGVQLSITDSEKEHPEKGRLVIDAPHLCAQRLITNDIAELHYENGICQFRIIGRTDNVICSGGIKLHIEEIEEQLRPHLTADFCITKRTDAKFGEAVVMLVERVNESTSGRAGEFLSNIMEICRNILPRYSVPKQIISVTQIPHTPNGKIDRATAMKVAEN